MHCGKFRFSISGAVLVVCLLLVVPVYAANTHGVPTGSQEMGAWFGDMFQPHIVSGCVPIVPGSGLTFAPFPCRAYVRATTGELVYVDQPSHDVGPLNTGDGTYWLALHRDTATVISGWTREAGTSYLWRKDTAMPALPPNALMLVSVTVASGNITSRIDLGYHSPRGYAVVWASQFLPLTGSDQIQAAINSLPPDGGTVMLEPGTYTLTDTVAIGNGGVGKLSTRHGVVLQGVARPGAGVIIGASTSVLFKWAGPTGGAMVRINGPLHGWGVQNIEFDGSNSAAVGLLVESGQFGDSRNLIFQRHTYAAIQSTCVPNFPGSSITDSLQNQWTNIRIWHLPPAISGSAAVVLDTSSPTCDTDVNTFTGLFIINQGVGTYGIYLGGADTNTFYNIHITNSATALASVLLNHDNPGSNIWPSDNQFFGLVMANQGIATQGTIPVGGERSANVFWGYANQGAAPGGSVLDLPDSAGIHVNENPPYDLLLMPPQGASAMLLSTLTHPRHFYPSSTNTAELGQGPNRWKNLYLSGGILRPSRTITASDSLNVASDWYIQATPTGNIVLTLGNAVAACQRDYAVKNTTAFNVVLTPSGGQLIDGLSSFTLSANPKAAIIVSDCSNWSILGTH